MTDIKLLRTHALAFARRGDIDYAALAKKAADEIERLRNLLFAMGAMENAPCFCCGYNGPGYFNSDTHSCAKHHRVGYGSEA